MQNEKIRERLNYVRIVGRGVEALENRKEHNDGPAVTAALLQESINKVKDDLFNGFKRLSKLACSE